MKAKFQLLTIFLILTILLSCRHDQALVADDICNTWEAKNFISLESVPYSKNGNTAILLIFRKDGTYSLKLDINSCGGDFTSGKNGKLEMEFPACTEACCDSKFSEKLVTMLPKVTTYEIDGNILQLHVPHWGYIECKIFSSLINPNP